MHIGQRVYFLPLHVMGTIHGVLSDWMQVVKGETNYIIHLDNRQIVVSRESEIIEPRRYERNGDYASEAEQVIRYVMQSYAVEIGDKTLFERYGEGEG